MGAFYNWFQAEVSEEDSMNDDSTKRKMKVSYSFKLFSRMKLTPDNLKWTQDTSSVKIENALRFLSNCTC